MESPWSCSQCTFLHKYPAQRCTMCSALRVTKKQMRDFVAGGPNNNNTTQQQSSNDTQSSVCTNNFTHNANNISGSVSAGGGGLPQNNYQSKINSQQHQQQSKSSSSTTTRNGLATATTMAINPYNTAAKQQPKTSGTTVANPYTSSAKSGMSNSTPHNRQQQQSNVVGTTTTNNNGNYNLLPIARTPPQQPTVGGANRGIVNNPYNNGTSLQSVAKIVGNNSNCNNPYTSARGTQVAMNVGNLNGGNEKESSHSFIQQTATNPMLNQQQQQQQQQHHNQKQQQQSSSSITYRNGTFVKEKQYQAGPIPICENTKHNWIYPINTLFPERTYQLQMSYTSIMSNTLVSLPTGLGKTLVAAVVMYNYYRWFPQGKVVFVAPTRPLVSQQIHACYKIMGIPEVHTAEISGRSKPDSRVAMWTNKRVFFATPQTLVKDIQENRCNPRNIVCVVMDEAHRATGKLIVFLVLCITKCMNHSCVVHCGSLSVH